MSTLRSADYVEGLVRELVKLRHETEWVEFKQNNSDPEEIGEYVSALANAAALAGKAFGYLLWGVQDSTHAVTGTSFSPATAKVWNCPGLVDTEKRATLRERVTHHGPT